MQIGIRQRGAALLMSLVILLVLTLLAVSGMQGSIMQERMASAQRDGVLALEVAETAMGEVEAILDGMSDLSDFGSTKGFYQTGDAPIPSDAVTWTKDTNGDNVSVADASAVNGIVPRYFIEYKGTVTLDAEGQLPRDMGQYGGSGPTEFDYARIVVEARGPSGQSRRLIEGFYVFQPGGLGGGA
ncbi:pilus assembly PilX family protein [Marinobacter sp. V034]|uniref:pilus assembly PilX family protein n=1 Tax=Marinobacter sp. V034 TaxID=3459610 RepID=UPI004044AC72